MQPIELDTTAGRLVIRQADLGNPDDLAAVLEMTAEYAKDPMGLGRPMTPEELDALGARLPGVHGAVVLVAWLEGRPTGIATCFPGFTTFTASPLLNIHDLSVREGARSLGIGAELLRAVKRRAAEMGCNRVTLEVREDNAARRLYEREAFDYGTPTMYFMKAVVEPAADGPANGE